LTAQAERDDIDRRQVSWSGRSLYTRLIDELQHRARKVLDDKSGGYSQRWLEGKQSDKGAKLTGQDFWELLSGPVHANVRAI